MSVLIKLSNLGDPSGVKGQDLILSLVLSKGIREPKRRGKRPEELRLTNALVRAQEVSTSVNGDPIGSNTLETAPASQHSR